MRATIPDWLADRLHAAGGSVPFRTYMEWVLHDPQHGYYGAGRARIGPSGDFATSPSLGPEFACLLLPQLIEWLDQLPGERLSLVEAGPGQGQLAAQVAVALANARPDLAARTELVLVEPNAGMVDLQRQALRQSPLSIRWLDWDGLRGDPLTGVVLAHEVLDALPVDRLLWDGSHWRWQHVSIQGAALALVAGPALCADERRAITAFDLNAPTRPPGWCTELHPGVAPWLQLCGQGLRQGVLLLMDYVLPAHRYYAPSRANGTLLAYRNQQASADPLSAPGAWDLTAHLCLETVLSAAASANWALLGERRQGEALLALGLAQRLSALGAASDVSLAERLRRREQLLRLVDPLATGDFRWVVLERLPPETGKGLAPPSCLQEPGALREPATDR